MAKVRVYELAKEFGVESKAVMAKLAELGEFVRSASSTVETPVVRKLQEAFPRSKGDISPASAAPKDPSAGNSAPPSVSMSPLPAPASSSEPAPQPDLEFRTRPPGISSSDQPGARAVASVAPSSPSQAIPPAVDSSSPTTRTSPGQVGSRPGPRPGNNPFMAKSTGMSRPVTSRPSPGAMPARQRNGNDPGAGRNAGGMASRSTGASRSGMPGVRPDGSGVRSAGSGGRFAAPSRRSTKPGLGGRSQDAGVGVDGSRPGHGAFVGPGVGAPRSASGRGGRGSTQGAFGRSGGHGGSGRGRKSKKQRRQEFDNMQMPSIAGVQLPRGGGEAIRLSRGASLTDLAEKINANPASLVQMLFHLGEMLTATQSVNDETLQLIGAELNFDIQVVSPEDEDRELLESFNLDFGEDAGNTDDLLPRPPVVTVMGHVDHGKTRLLDAIRKTDVISGEAGGITQHIGAYQVRFAGRAITFIDTPGHEAFTAMRARGAQVADIAVLVVAADDGVKPQTVEALEHARAANVPIVVAINKVDKESADPQRVRGQLTEHGLVAEEYGGDTLAVDISAKGGTGIDDLLEAILLTADAALELKANPNQSPQGVAIEAHLDRGRGPVATVLIQRGTLRISDSVVAGEAFGRVRAMLDENGQSVTAATPSRPVQVLGFTSVPDVGDSVLVVDEDRVARQIAERRQSRERNAQRAANWGRRTLEDILADLEKSEVTHLNLILKGDVSGSVEALKDALDKIEVGGDVSLQILHSGVGAITENDVTRATSAGAMIIGFNVRPESKARELAESEDVDVRHYSVIYQAIEDVETALKSLLKPEFEEVQLGTAEIREVFRSSKYGNIAGCLVQSGVVVRHAKARLIRNTGIVADNLAIQSLRRFTDDATEVREGFECGIGFGSYDDIQVGDIVESFQMREKPRS